MKAMFSKLAAYIAAPLILAACSPAPHTHDAGKSVSEKGHPIMPQHILQKTSPHSFAVTESKIREAIGARPLNLFGEVPHSKGAAKAGLDLPASTLFIFGNPKGGTPLMARNPEMGIELPLKIHVFEKDGVVTISYTHIAAIVESYGGDPSALPTPKIAEMLEGLVGSVVAQ